MRGDIITKIQDYDARDIRNVDAQTLFRSAGNRIRLVVHRDSKLAVTKNIRNDDSPSPSRCPSAIPPYRQEINLLQYDFNELDPVASLPHTNFLQINDNANSRSVSRASNFSPMPTRDYQQEINEETAAIVAQVSGTQ